MTQTPKSSVRHPMNMNMYLKKDFSFEAWFSPFDERLKTFPKLPWVKEGLYATPSLWSGGGALPRGHPLPLQACLGVP